MSVLVLPLAILLAAGGVLLGLRARAPGEGWGGAFLLSLSGLMAGAVLLAEGPARQGVEIAGHLSLVLTGLGFCLAFTGRGRRWWGWGALPALAAGGMLLQPAPALPSGGLFWGQLWPAAGWAGAAFAIGAATIAMLAAGLGLPRLRHAARDDRPGLLLLAAGPLMIIVAALAEAAGLWPGSDRPLVYGLGGALTLVGLLLLRRNSLLPAARTAVFDRLPEAVLVLDPADRLIDLNPAASQFLNRPAAEIIGRPLAEVWPAALPAGGLGEGEHSLQLGGNALTFEVHSTPLANLHGQPIGRALTLRNTTTQERLAAALQTQANDLTRTNRLVTALSMVASRLGTAADTEVVLEALGRELRALGLGCGVAAIDAAGEAATLRYLPFTPSALHALEALTGLALKGHVIPRRYWPGLRILTDKAPIWYPTPQGILRQLFPQIPEGAAKRAFQLLGVPITGQICLLPLRVGDRVIGAMAIWGADLNPADSPVLAVFASQVASSLQTAEAYAAEARRANELARSNTLMLGLARVAAQLDTASHFSKVVEAFGAELKRLGADCMVGTIDGEKQFLTIQYVSIHQEVVRWAERVTGHSLTDLTIPRQLWPTDKVVTDKVPYWDPNGMRGTLNIFTILPVSVQRAAMQMAGINLDDPVIYLPLAHADEVIGVLAVWGASLQPEDTPALSVFASLLATAIQNSRLYEQEAHRARELALLLEASEATSSASQLEEVLLTLAKQLLELSGLESCYISEWDKETNQVWGRLDHSRVYWREEKREVYPLSAYPRSRQVLRTGRPLLLEGDFEAEEKAWMTELGRTALIGLAMYAQENIIGLVELANKTAKPFDPQALAACTQHLERAAGWLQAPVTANAPKRLLQLAEALKHLAGAEICSISEWDPAADCLRTIAVAADVIWESGSGPSYQPEHDTTWAMALEHGQASVFVRTEGNLAVRVGVEPTSLLDVETLVVFPLQRGEERIGLIELYDFNQQTQVSPTQLAFLRTVADKASYSIQNARLLQQTRKRLGEKTALLHEKEVLLKEVHHRVKNNLQVISSLLNLQAARLADPQTREALRESQHRVRTMALIHEKLYQSTDLAQIDFAAYLHSLVSYLRQSYRDRSEQVTILVRAEGVQLEIETALPCGLIVNELVSNALKHAFPAGRAGEIVITLTPRAAGRAQLVVSDDGVGLAPGVEIQRSSSLGLQLVHALVQQIGGDLRLESGPGARFVLEFPYQPAGR